MTVNPVNDAPQALNQVLVTKQNTPIIIALAGTDTEGAALAFAILTQPAKGTLSGTLPILTYTPNPNATGADSFTFVVSDGQLLSNAGTVSITIQDGMGPIVTGGTYTPDPLPVGTPLTLTAIVSDAATGGSNVVSAEYQIGQGAFAPMNAADNNFNQVTEGVTAVVPAFTSPGVNSVCIRGKDAAGNTGPLACLHLAVYDPDGGFVTGGGWMNSPENAYWPDGINPAGLSTRVNFEFVSKYQKGATSPKGQMEFQVRSGNFNFRSTVHEWLVVSGSKALLEGSGTVNGAGDYGFLLTVIDGDPSPGSDKTDKFRIKIWNNATGLTVYDNARGSDEMDDTKLQVIGGGSIVIHQK